MIWFSVPGGRISVWVNDLFCDPEDQDHLWNPTYQWGIRRHTPKLYQYEKIDSSWCCTHSSHFHCDTNMYRKSCYLSYKIRKIVPDQDELNRHWCNVSLAASLLKHWERQNAWHFADYIFKYISWNENFWISNKISFRYVSKGAVDIMSAFVKIMVSCRTGDKPLSDPMMTQFTDEYMHHLTSRSYYTETWWYISINELGHQWISWWFVTWYAQ